MAKKAGRPKKTTEENIKENVVETKVEEVPTETVENEALEGAEAKVEEEPKVDEKVEEPKTEEVVDEVKAEESNKPNEIIGECETNPEFIESIKKITEITEENSDEEIINMYSRMSDEDDVLIVPHELKEKHKKEENKTNTKLTNLFGYVWNGQEIDY